MQVAQGPIPKDWLYPPGSKVTPLQPILKKIINHWTVTGYTPSQECLDSYHFVIDGEGKVHRGSRDIDSPIGHTFMFNSAIGLSISCMGGWNGASTPYPPTKAQWETLVNANRQLCQTYGIPVDRSHVLMHGEVTEVLGVDQWGKWDIGYLPHLGIQPENGTRCGNALRQAVLGGVDASPTGENPPVKVRLQGSKTILTGFLLDGATMVPLRPFVHWAKEAGYKINLESVDTQHKTYYLKDTNQNFAEAKPILEKGYIQIRDTGYAELRDITGWMGLNIAVEKWPDKKAPNTDRVVVVKRDDG